MTDTANDPKCEVRPEYEGTGSRVTHPHGGKVRLYRLEADSQPPGHGSATIETTVFVCAKHIAVFFDGDWQTSNIRLRLAA